MREDAEPDLVIELLYGPVCHRWLLTGRVPDERRIAVAALGVRLGLRRAPLAVIVAVAADAAAAPPTIVKAWRDPGPENLLLYVLVGAGATITRGRVPRIGRVVVVSRGGAGGAGGAGGEEGARCPPGREAPQPFVGARPCPVQVPSVCGVSRGPRSRRGR
ncbi:hypothetical protein [Streptomyces sp. NPDC048845]|uniref:hypothetical protein n=1 Tax=Streptomyces sp. NPDC048845 TaxID=3155390 RepID=UPI003443857A